MEKILVSGCLYGWHVRYDDGDIPSCGCHFIYDGSFTDTKIKGQGRAAQLLQEAGFPVIDEHQL